MCIRDSLVLVVIGVERERPGDGALGEGGRQLGATEQRRLRAVVEGGNLAQYPFGSVAVDDVAASEETKRAKAGGAAQETAPAGSGHQRGCVLDQQLGIDAGNDFGWAHDDPPIYR